MLGCGGGCSLQVLGVHYVMQVQAENPVASCPKPSVHSSTIVEVGAFPQHPVCAERTPHLLTPALDENPSRGQPMEVAGHTGYLQAIRTYTCRLYAYIAK